MKNSIMGELIKISATSGIKHKKHLLSKAVYKFPLLKKLIFYAYNPYMNFYIRKFPVVQEPKETKPMDHTVFKTLEMFNARKITGNSLITHYLDLVSTFSKADRVLFNMVLSRDLRIGLNIKSINHIWPGLIPEFNVMLAQKIDWSRIIYPCYSSVKLDGVRGIYNSGNFFTRSGRMLFGLDHIADCLKGAPMIDGELMVYGFNFQVSCGNIRTLKPSPNAFFCLFDLPESNSSFPERLKSLKEYCSDNSFIKFVKHRIVSSELEARDHYKRCRVAGYEGTVLKPLNYLYKGKRSHDWMKIKAINSEDLKVIGWYEGSGKYANQLGGLVGDFFGIPVRVGGGFSDLDRKKIWGERKKYLGKIMEVLYQEKTPSGSMRHPRFLRWRFDK